MGSVSFRRGFVVVLSFKGFSSDGVDVVALEEAEVICSSIWPCGYFPSLFTALILELVSFCAGTVF